MRRSRTNPSLTSLCCHLIVVAVLLFTIGLSAELMLHWVGYYIHFFCIIAIHLNNLCLLINYLFIIIFQNFRRMAMDSCNSFSLRRRIRRHRVHLWRNTHILKTRGDGCPLPRVRRCDLSGASGRAQPREHRQPNQPHQRDHRELHYPSGVQQYLEGEWHCYFEAGERRGIH